MNLVSLQETCSHFNQSHIQEFEKPNAEEIFVSPLGISLHSIPNQFSFQEGHFSHEEEKTHFSAFHCAKYLIYKNLRNNINPDENWVKLFSALRSRLLTSNMGLVHTCLSQVMSSFKDEAKLFSDGSFALLRCVDFFDPWAGVLFVTYAYGSIKKSLYKKQHQYVSMEDGTENNIEFRNRTEIESDYKEAMEIIDKNSAELNDREKLVLFYRYGLYDFSKLNLEEIGEKIGVCAERVRQIQNKALGKLNEAFLK